MEISNKETEYSPYLTRRLFNEKNNIIDGREPFARDRDRIIHSKAFRRMMHKTQIFNANKGDHFRNRLTHTLEVSQIGRSLGRLLDLNEDLIEAIALGHDVGHTPFGHVGERTLDSILNNGIDNDVPSIHEGFKHNFQSVRILDSIENRCNDYCGLNLTLATREGIIKHTKIKKENPAGHKELIHYSPVYLHTSEFRMDLDHSYTLEGQVVAISDEIAQLTHDIDDGIRGKIISFNDFFNTDLVQHFFTEETNNQDKNYNERNRIIKELVGRLIYDVANESRKRIADYHRKYGVPSFADEKSVYENKCILFSNDVYEMAKDLKDKRESWIIISKEISQADSKAEYMIKQIFKAYYKHPKELPDYILSRYYGPMHKDVFDRTVINESQLKNDPYFIRLICDHIAGMSDQYAAREYMALYFPEYY